MGEYKVKTAVVSPLSIKKAGLLYFIGVSILFCCRHSKLSSVERLKLNTPLCCNWHFTKY
ncbi:hypothetical protein PCA01_20290 [Pseudoalteromonas carrageenovora]|nr:hypothetical protein PCA01_20290 [Pseudoalteromonas carrageenovora]